MKKNFLKNERNSWEYYFKKFNNYSLSEIYNSKNVFLSNMKFEKYGFGYDKSRHQKSI